MYPLHGKRIVEYTWRKILAATASLLPPILAILGWTIAGCIRNHSAVNYGRRNFHILRHFDPREDPKLLITVISHTRGSRIRQNPEYSKLMDKCSSISSKCSGLRWVLELRESWEKWRTTLFCLRRDVFLSMTYGYVFAIGAQVDYRIDDLTM